jgi:hypothetical protein
MSTDHDLALVRAKPPPPCRRERRLQLDLDVEVLHPSAAEADEMVVRIRPRVIEGRTRVRRQAAHHTELPQQVERRVDSWERDPGQAAPYPGLDLVRRGVPAERLKGAMDYEALRRHALAARAKRLSKAPITVLRHT